MNNVSKYRSVFIVILVISLLLRVGLALVNREANDNHMEAVQQVIETGHLPVLRECRECFHPKLFYITAAGLLQLLSITEPDNQVIAIQLLNFIAGMITVAVIYRFIREYPSDDEVLKILIFALVVLNPKLIAIHSQASNDSFLILFSTLALYFAYHFLKQPSPKLLALTILILLLTISAKAMGWLTFASIVVSLLVTSLGVKNKIDMIANVFILVVAVLLLSVINPLSQILVNIQKFGTPVVNSAEKIPLPSFSQKTYRYKDHKFRPGIVSIQDGFFTFKFTDLIQLPMITNEPRKFPPHRTSFWTMLYADSHSLHFQNWPPSWQTRENENFNVSRGIFVLALPTIFITFVGLLRELKDFFKSLFHWERFKTGNNLFLISFFANIIFLVLAALLYRDFSFIKLIYILSGLLAFTWMLLRGLEVILDWSPIQILWKPKILVSCWVGILCIFYIMDVLLMIFQLYAINVYPGQGLSI